MEASQVVLAEKNPPANAEDVRDAGWIPGSGRFPWRWAWQPTPVFLPGESHGQRSLVGYGAWGRKESDTKNGVAKSRTQLKQLSKHMHSCNRWFLLLCLSHQLVSMNYYQTTGTHTYILVFQLSQTEISQLIQSH